MGKRKSSKPAPKGKKDTLSTSFKCLFCNHEKSVSVSMDKKGTMFAKLKCKDCGQNFQAPINNLSLAVDVYADWVDACEEARLKQPPKERPQRNPNTLEEHGFAGGARMTMIGNEEDDDDDDLDAEGEAAPEEDVESDVDSLLEGRPAKRRERRRSSDSPPERSRGKSGKQKEKDRRPAKKAKPVELDDDDDDDD